MPLPPGSTLGPYRIVAPLGAGGMGEVYRAHDARLGRDLALKVLPPETMADENARARLTREARTASSLNHPHIAHIYDVGEDRGHLFIAMELVEGSPLRERIQKGAIPPESVLNLASHIAAALAYAHKRGVIHRDLKSANVMVTPEGWAKVLDFGLAKRVLAEADVDADSRFDPNLTATGLVLGTPSYLPPEVLLGGTADARSDVWAFGIVLYEMATGKVPFAAGSVGQLADAIVNTAPAPISGRVPVGLRAVIERCLAKEPEARYRDGGELYQAIEALEPRERGAASWRRRVWIPAAALLLLIGGGLALNLQGYKIGGLTLPSVAPKGSKAITSLAVLPLANLSGDPGQEYFANGMTEELITDLASIRSLKVISRTSAMQYKDSKKSLRQIARELGVDAVVEGSVLRAGNRVRITAQLIEAASDKHLWARSYERDVTDVLALQSEVARDIAREIQMELTAQESSRLAESPRVDPEAYDLYLKGRHEWSKVTVEGVRKGIEYFEKALERDPTDARYSSGLADAWLVLQQVLGAAPTREGLQKVKQYARQALNADDRSAEAHSSMAAALFFGDWNWKDAETHARRSIELKPSYSTARVVYSAYLGAAGRFAESIEQDRVAEELDPLSPIVKWNAIGNLYFARRYDEALAKAREMLRADSTSMLAHGSMFRIYEVQGKYQDALDIIARHVPEQMGSKANAERLRKGAALGKEGYWRAVLAQAPAQGKSAPESLIRTAMIYAQLGERDRALDLLEQAARDHMSDVLFINSEPLFDPLRAEPRFQALVRSVGIPQRASS